MFTIKAETGLRGELVAYVETGARNRTNLPGDSHGLAVIRQNTSAPDERHNYCVTHLSVDADGLAYCFWTTYDLTHDDALALWRDRTAPATITWEH